MSALRTSWPVLSAGVIAVVALAIVPSHGNAAPPPTTSNVLVVNPPTSPVPIARRDNPARQPWQFQVPLDLTDGQASTTVFLPNPPAGKRIVIEFGSAYLIALKEQMPALQIGVSQKGTDAQVVHYFGLNNAGSHSDGQFSWQSSHPLSLYVTEGTIYFNRSNGALGPLFGSMSLSGHLEDVD